MKRRYAIFFVSSLVVLLSVTTFVLTNFGKRDDTSTAPHYTFSLMNTYPHDSNAFTEGLVYDDGYLYESTGLYGSSTLRCVDLQTGNVLRETPLPSQFFGEGIAVVNNTIVQLTWKSHVGFVYDKNSFALISNFSYSTEGWGLTFDGEHLIMSNGSDVLSLYNPRSYLEIGQIKVHDGNSPVFDLNELEFINGEVYANVWHSNEIVAINPGNGQVKFWINLSGLAGSAVYNSESVLNGIAYDSASNQLLVTGKNWPQIYEIKMLTK
jgi:glutamine cyclotransferase